MAKVKTPRYGHPPITMRLVANGSLEKTGDYKIVNVDDVRKIIVIAIPCAADPNKWVASRWHINHPSSSGWKWTWNSDVHKPTMKPSLHAVGVWHGWVTNGELVEA